MITSDSRVGPSIAGGARSTAGRASCYEYQLRLTEVEIQSLRRIGQMADRKAYETHNGARLATAELALTQAETVGAVSVIATIPPPFSGSPRPHRTEPRVAKLTYGKKDPGRRRLGSARMVDLMREEHAAEGCIPPNYRRYVEERVSQTCNV